MHKILKKVVAIIVIAATIYVSTLTSAPLLMLFTIAVIAIYFRYLNNVK
jgi:hypothetical protein